MEEDEAQTPTRVPFPSNVEDAGGRVDDQSDLNHQRPSVTKGLAEFALEDSEPMTEYNIIYTLTPLCRNNSYVQ